MLVSPREVLVQDLRRQDLLIQALDDGVARHRSSLADHRPISVVLLRQAVSAVLIRAGERLRSSSPAPAAVGGD